MFVYLVQFNWCYFQKNERIADLNLADTIEKTFDIV